MLHPFKKLHSMNERVKYNYLRIILIGLVLLLITSLFKNISYPLFWADESMTVMHGKRVLEHGFPKVHDGKNVLYDLRHPNPTLGIDERTDAFIGGANWGQYYVAAIGVKLAELTSDIFLKTAIIRTIFTLIGLAGLAIFAFLTSQFFSSSLSRAGFLILFVFLELISVPLVLHLREARYYPVTVFFAALSVFFYTRHRILNKSRYARFLTLLTASLSMLFVTFSPSYFIFLAAILLFESALLLRNLFRNYAKGRGGKKPEIPSPHEAPFMYWLQGILPVILSLIVVSPLMVFFRISHIAEEMAKINRLLAKTDSMQMYLDNLSFIWRYCASSDLIYLAILLKLGLLVCFGLRVSHKIPLSPDIAKATFSKFLTIYFIVYFVAIAKIPNYLFTRYFILLQPVLSLIILLDAGVIYNFISQWQSSAAVYPVGKKTASYRDSKKNGGSYRVYSKGALIFVFMGFVFYNISTNMGNIKGHVYEISLQNRGPLDYVIPFIKEKYGDTDNLVIATNYEETSFMYYLNSKVTVGFVGNNLEQDALIIPDVIVYRKSWGDFEKIFSSFFMAQRYSRIVFPAVDYPTNNSPELNWAPPFVHRFGTEEPDNVRGEVDIYLRM